MKKKIFLSISSALLMLCGTSVATAQEVGKTIVGNDKSKEVVVANSGAMNPSGAFLLKKAVVDVPGKGSVGASQRVMVTYVLKNLTTEPLSDVKLNLKSERKDVSLKSTTCKEILGSLESCSINITFVPKHSRTAELVVFSSNMQLPVESLID